MRMCEETFFYCANQFYISVAKKLSPSMNWCPNVSPSATSHPQIMLPFCWMVNHSSFVCLIMVRLYLCLPLHLFTLTSCCVLYELVGVVLIKQHKGIAVYLLHL